jgi:hypothetical protein
MKKNLIKVEFALKDSILANAKEAIKLAPQAAKLRDASDKLFDQYDALVKKSNDIQQNGKAILGKMAPLANSIEADYKKLVTQIKALGLDESAIADVADAVKAVTMSDFYNVEKDLEFYVKTELPKIK